MVSGRPQDKVLIYTQTENLTNGVGAVTFPARNPDVRLTGTFTNQFGFTLYGGVIPISYDFVQGYQASMIAGCPNDSTVYLIIW